MPTLKAVPPTPLPDHIDNPLDVRQAVSALRGRLDQINRASASPPPSPPPASAPRMIWWRSAGRR